MELEERMAKANEMRRHAASVMLEYWGSSNYTMWPNLAALIDHTLLAPTSVAFELGMQAGAYGITRSVDVAELPPALIAQIGHVRTVKISFFMPDPNATKHPPNVLMFVVHRVGSANIISGMVGCIHPHITTTIVGRHNVLHTCPDCSYFRSEKPNE